MFNNKTENYSPKWKIKKQKQKVLPNPQTKIQERFQEYYRNLSQDEEIKIRNCINKNMSDEGNERKKNIWESITIKNY